MPGLKLVLSSEIKTYRLYCPECKLILREPVQTVEGVRLCRTCYDDIARQPGYTSPQSGVSVQAEDGNLSPCFFDKAVQREILKLQVQCDNREYGCNWSGQLSDYTEEHYKNCHNYPLKCEHCQEQVLRKDMDNHMNHECCWIKCTCGEVLNRHTSEEDPRSILTHLKNPVVLIQHLIATFTMAKEIIDKVKHIDTQLTAIQNGEILQAALAATCDGSFMWRITDLSKHKHDAIDGHVTSLYSPLFYTAKNGYKMCIRVYLNGDGIGHGTHLSLFFVLMKGEFDALQKWPFDHKVSLILIDQSHRRHIVQTFKPTPESSSFQRPISDMNVASGCPQFCDISILDNDNYTKDDVLFIKCIVDTSCFCSVPEHGPQGI